MKAPASFLALCLAILAAMLIVILAVHVEPAQAGTYMLHLLLPTTLERFIKMPLCVAFSGS